MAVSYVGAGTAVYDNATSPLTVTRPTCNVGDLLVMFVGQKPSSANGGTVTTPSGWTLVGQLTGAGGYGTTLGADTGNTNLRIYTKVAVAGDSGTTLSLAHGKTNVLWARILAFRSATGVFDTSGFASGSDTSSGTAVSATMSSNPGITVGDMVAWGMCIPTDVTTPSQFSSHNITQTGVTYGTKTEVGELDSSTNNDIGGFIAYAPVSSGTGTANPVITATAGGTTTNVRGPVCMIRMREGAAAAITGSGAPVEPSTPDTASGSGTVAWPAISGSGAATEAATPDTASGAGTVFWATISGAGAAVEAGVDLAAGSGTLRISGAGAATEAGADSATCSGGVRVQGSGAATEAATADSCTASGGLRVSGQGAATEAATLDVLAGSADVDVTGSSSLQEFGIDTAFAEGTVETVIWGSGALLETGADSAASTGWVRVAGQAAPVETLLDLAASSGTVLIFGQGSASESGLDALSGLAMAIVSGQLSLFELGDDILGGSGQVVVQGSGSPVESGWDIAEGVGYKMAEVGISVSATSLMSSFGEKGGVTSGLMDLLSSVGESHITGSLGSASIFETVAFLIGSSTSKFQRAEVEIFESIRANIYPFIEGMEKFPRYQDVRRREVEFSRAPQSLSSLNARRRPRDFECIIRRKG